MTPRRMGMWMAVAALAGCAANEPGAVAKRFWRAYAQGDLADLEALVTEASRDAVKYVGVDEEMKDAQIELGEVRIEAGGNRASVTTTLKRKDAGELNVETVLLREQGSWKVALHETHASVVGGAFKGLGEAFMRAMDETAKYLGRGAAEAGARLNEMAGGEPKK